MLSIFYNIWQNLFEFFILVESFQTYGTKFSPMAQQSEPECIFKRWETKTLTNIYLIISEKCRQYGRDIRQQFWIDGSISSKCDCFRNWYSCQRSHISDDGIMPFDMFSVSFFQTLEEKLQRHQPGMYYGCIMCPNFRF